MSRTLRATVVIALTAALAASTFATGAAADGPVTPPPSLGGTWVPVECFRMSGDFQSFNVKNTAGGTIPKGTTVRWTDANGKPGATLLGVDLAPGATAKLVTGLGLTATCTAQFNAGLPDLVVKSVAWTSDTHVAITIENKNLWVAPAASFNVRVQSMKCFEQLVDGKGTSATIGKGETKTLTFLLAKGSAVYLKGTVDTASQVMESNEDNNDATSVEYQACAPK